MNAILDKFKKIFSSPEAQEFTQELKETADKLQKEAENMTSKVMEKTVETTSAVSEKAKTVKHAVETGLRTDGKIGFEDFQKVEVKVGTILSVDAIEKSDKLLLLKVDLGEQEPRQIVSGIKTYFDDITSLVNRQAMFVTNLEPREIFGHVSNGMIFAVNDKDNFSILEPDTTITPGTKAS